MKQGILHNLTQPLKTSLQEHNLEETWDSLTDIQRNEFICWVTSAKKEETQEKRMRIMVENLQEGKRNPCCWPGCPHRRPNAQKWFK